ncbi:MAG: tetratricopeptide repeat protein [Betaproteobacteria bacterium]|nr:tetratricopeptide repeat protein [Betaproteobacteria bacterium]
MRKLATEALARCPDYGRANHALAKGLELQRYAIDVHRADYERRFAAMPMPVVPGIEQYVVNWQSLSPRHRKRVALSVAPWKAFVPVLVAGGSTFFIKPIYLKLSESPGLEVLKDQRINTDSRLWDDVRGAGGFATVTGIEDVERTISDKYNTVLHEMTHQVHGVLTADQAREIQDLYRRAKEREVVTHNAFLSRYASGTVWEYFAEGANGLLTPQRDTYDPRDVVRERLASIDPDLMALEKRFLAITDVRANLPIAYLNAGSDELSKGKLDKAMVHFQRAVKAAPGDEAVLVGRLNALGIQGDRAATLQAAQQVLQRFPASGGAQTNAAEALWHTGQALVVLVARLDAARPKVAKVDRWQVDLALGGYYYRLGNVAKALAAFDRVLAYQSDNPEAMWGKGATLALAGRWDEAFPFYERTLRLRTGVVELRADYARDLLRAGHLDVARIQLDAARLLNPTDPTIQALDGWHALLSGNNTAALAKADAALKEGEWCDLARIVRAMALQAQGKHGEAMAAVKPLRERIVRRAPPGYVYRQISAAWISVHELPVVERRLLADLR